MNKGTDKKIIPEELYKNILDLMPICTVDVVFFNQKKDKTLLFLRKNNPLKGVYFSMGGRLNKEETLMACAVRQTQKELGLDIDEKKLILGGVQQENHSDSAFGLVSYHAVDVFYGYVLEKEDVAVKLDDQHSESKWFSVGDDSLHPLMKSKIKQALSAMKTQKYHD